MNDISTKPSVKRSSIWVARYVVSLVCVGTMDMDIFYRFEKDGLKVGYVRFMHIGHSWAELRLAPPTCGHHRKWAWPPFNSRLDCTPMLCKLHAYRTLRDRVKVSPAHLRPSQEVGMATIQLRVGLYPYVM